MYYSGCICGNNDDGTIENCFVIDGNIDGWNPFNYGIARENGNGKIINSYAISNKGNVGDRTVTNSYGSTTGSVPDDFYTNTLTALNGLQVTGCTWCYPSLYI